MSSQSPRSAPVVANQDPSSAENPGRTQGGRSRKSASAFRTISEVATLLDVQQHVLRFWETKFSQIRPLKRGGGRRYYRPEDVALLQSIHHLLYTEGYTIKGVQKLLKEQGKAQVVEGTLNAANEAFNAAQESVQAPQAASTQPLRADRPLGAEALSANQRNVLESMLAELKELRSLVKSND